MVSRLKRKREVRKGEKVLIVTQCEVLILIQAWIYYLLKGDIELHMIGIENH